jgi:hypothetical protein
MSRGCTKLTLVAQLGASIRLRLARSIHLIRWLSQRLKEEQHLQAAFLVARNLLDDRRIRVDQERRRRSA